MDPGYRIVEIFGVSLRLVDDFFPVPLVDIDRMQIVDLFVFPYGIHIGIQTVSLIEDIVMKGHAFPFGQRVNDHALLIDERGREVDRLCLAVQVIIETCAFQNEEGSGYPFQVESFRKLFFKCLFDETDRGLCLVQVQ